MPDIDDEFARFVDAHSRALFAAAYLLTRDQHAAEELLQGTLVRLYPKWSLVMAARVPLAYVRRAVANEFVSQMRRPASRAVALAQLPDRIGQDDPADVVTDRQVLWQLLADLSGRQRTALVLRYFYDEDDATIAHVLGCRRVTARSVVSRGLANLRRTWLAQADATAPSSTGGDR